ncbi:MAG: sodium-dependent transporter [Chlamydiales bacterium]|nr:sodium-dependent transporter [Chlamydiales bacterium]
MSRAKWKSKVGFMWAAIGSAIGLGSIWRFPYIVGENGGGAFLIIFLICLFLVSFPVLIAEVVIGRKAQSSPYGSFLLLSQSNNWGNIGKLTILTGFLVSSFYSVISGFTLGYLVESVRGHVTSFHKASEVAVYFQGLTNSPFWTVGYHFLFFSIAIWILYIGVQKGIEDKNKFLMPLLFLILIVLAGKGLTLPGAKKGLYFLFYPDFTAITPSMVVMALGQAFFGISLGQGTMVTYGSYLSKKENILKTCFPIVCSVIFVSLLAGIAIFPIVFGAGMEVASGPDLMFKTLPLILSDMKGGYFFAILFFLLVFLAALTSQISALEPIIAYLMDEKKWTRHKAVLISGLMAFIVGIPSALSFGVLRHITLFGMTFFELISNLCVNFLIPIGGLGAVLLVGWKWGLHYALRHIEEGAKDVFKQFNFLEKYLIFSIKYFCPIVIIVILMNILGIF